MTVPVTRIPEPFEVLDRHGSPEGPASEVRLTVDRRNPFFFDHPLDHVPAMLLVEGALALAARADAAAPHPGRAVFRFGRFCEFTPEPVLRLTSGGAGAADAVRVEFVQGEQVIGSAEMVGLPAGQPLPEAPYAPAPDGIRPVAAELVHRTRAQNVLIGRDSGATSAGNTHSTTAASVTAASVAAAPVTAPEEPPAVRVTLLDPPPGHWFRRQSPTVRPLGEIVEGIRQFGTLLAHEARDVALGRQFIVKTIAIEVDRLLPRGLPVTLLSTGLPRHRGRGNGRLDFTIHAGTEPCGTATVEGTVVSAGVYQRLREAVR